MIADSVSDQAQVSDEKNMNSSTAQCVFSGTVSTTNTAYYMCSYGNWEHPPWHFKIVFIFLLRQWYAFAVEPLLIDLDPKFLPKAINVSQPQLWNYS